jgi:hypothetical protein
MKVSAIEPSNFYNRAPIWVESTLIEPAHRKPLKNNKKTETYYH